MRDFPELRRVEQTKPGCEYSFAPLVDLPGANKACPACWSTLLDTWRVQRQQACVRA